MRRCLLITSVAIIAIGLIGGISLGIYIGIATSEDFTIFTPCKVLSGNLTTDGFCECIKTANGTCKPDEDKIIWKGIYNVEYKLDNKSFFAQVKSGGMCGLSRTSATKSLVDTRKGVVSCLVNSKDGTKAKFADNFDIAWVFMLLFFAIGGFFLITAIGTVLGAFCRCCGVEPGGFEATTSDCAMMCNRCFGGCCRCCVNEQFVYPDWMKDDGRDAEKSTNYHRLDGR